MKAREEVARFINVQLEYGYVCPRNKGTRFHYGKQELRELMDFIYDGVPSSNELIGIKDKPRA